MSEVKHAFPCVRCQKRSGFSFPTTEARYKYRCPGCKTVYEARVFDLLHIDVVTQRSQRSLIDLVAPSLFESVSFELKVLDPILQTRARVKVDPVRPRCPRDQFSDTRQVALIYKFQEEDLLAACNLEKGTWLTTITGALFRGRAALGMEKA